MAGAGSRFQQAGYSLPKPLIPIDGKPMIEWVLSTLPECKTTFIVQSQHIRDFDIARILESIRPDCNILETDGLTEGAACTTLLAERYIDKADNLLIANSDQYVEFFQPKNDFEKYFDHLDGTIFVFNNNHPKWSYAKVDRKTNYITEVAEKNPISNWATCGIYYWDAADFYYKSVYKMIFNNKRVNNEFYICPAYNEAIESGHKFTIEPVREMWGLGTPEDLEIFKEKHATGYFN